MKPTLWTQKRLSVIDLGSGKGVQQLGMYAHWTGYEQ